MHMMARKIMRAWYYWLTLESSCNDYVQKCHCRCPILSELPFHFNICWTLGPFMSRFEFEPRTYSVMCFIYLSSFESFYSDLDLFALSVVSCFYYFCLLYFIMCSYYDLLRFFIICFYYVVIYVSVASLLFYSIFCYILLLHFLLCVVIIFYISLDYVRQIVTQILKLNFNFDLDLEFEFLILIMNFNLNLILNFDLNVKFHFYCWFGSSPISKYAHDPSA